MSIINFEEYTIELSKDEMKVAVLLAKKISLNVGKENAVSNERIIKAFGKYDVKLKPSKVRKMIQFIRQEGLVSNLCANSRGYFVAANQTEVNEYVKGLQQRVNSIQYTLQCFKKYSENVS